MGEDLGPTAADRRRFDRGLRPDHQDALVERLRARGVADELIAAEQDLSVLAADVNIRGTERISLRQAAAEVGLDLGEARHVWHSVGIAVGDDDEPAFAPAEVQVLRFYAAASAVFGEEAVLQALRVIGSAFVRVAEAEVAVLRLAYEVPHLASGGSDVELTEGYERLSQMLLPEVEAVFTGLHRLHLARASRRAWAVDADSSATLARLAVGFADLADFTSLSGRVTAGELAGIVDAFDEQVSELVLLNGGQVVKLIGDEVMFTADDPADGLRIARVLVTRLSGAVALPAVRVGVAAGEVLNRDGDYYGSVVNLAARLVTLAEPGEVLVDAALAEVAGAGATEALPPVEVKGFADPVATFRLLG